MTSLFRNLSESRLIEAALRRIGGRRDRLALGAAVAAYGLIGISAMAPPGWPSDADRLAAYVEANAQSITVPQLASERDTGRDGYGATPGIQTLVAGGTNHDWAKLVLLFGGWLMTDDNVTVVLRWMRQENGPDNWWNRNNPLNNGFGSGGGGGTGRYADLVVAAQKAAENLHRHPGFQPIVDALAASAPTTVIEQAIWGSPWASGHYANGSHWHYFAVPVVSAPVDAWQ